jgi:hypothetical protein
MKVAIVSDAWRPQVNGVVTTLRRTSEALEALGHRVQVFSPDGHRTIPCPTYPRDSPRAVAAQTARGRARTTMRPTRSISRPKGR